MMASRCISNLLKSISYLPAAKRNIFTTAHTLGIKSRWQAPLRREFFNRKERYEKSGVKQPQDIRSEYIEWNYEAELYAFGCRLHENFEEVTLRQALIDSSYIAQEVRRQQDLGVDVPALKINDNSELAAAGSAVIVNFCTKFVRSSLPVLPEEGVRAIVDYLTSEEILSTIGNGIGLKDLILTEEYPPSPFITAKAFQAIVASVNVSSGLEQCHKFMKDFIATQLVGKDIYDIWQIEDPINVLSDILERSGKGEPDPRLLSQTGKNTIHAVYQVGIYSDKQFIGAGFGESVEESVKQAAWDALKRLFQTSSSNDPLPFEKKEIKLNEKTNLSLNEWSIDKASNIVMC